MPSTTQPSWAAWVTIIGIIGVVVIGIVAMLHYSDASDAVSVVAPVTGVVSTLVGAFFGVRTASLAQQKANEAAGIHARILAGPAAPADDGAREDEPTG